MENGDIAVFEKPVRACIFEGLIASPPKTSKKLLNIFSKKDHDTKPLHGWEANELPLKSLIDSVNRLNAGTFLFSLLGSDMEEPIYKWLVRKGVALPVYCYDRLEDFREDIKYNRALHTIYVVEQEHAAVLGLRAKVVLPTTTWGY